MPVTWDERKRLLNLEKHGLDFATALYTQAQNKRIKAVGKLGLRLSVLILKPLGEEAIALISLRAASEKEREVYALQVETSELHSGGTGGT